MEASGLPFKTSFSTLQVKFFVCCQNGSLSQLEEVLEEEVVDINHRHHSASRCAPPPRARDGRLTPARRRRTG